MEIELISKKIEDLEQELNTLKNLISTKKKSVSLKGIFKDINFTEEDITKAKRSLLH